MNNKVQSIKIIAGNYPYPGQMKLVFVQQLVHALLDLGVKVTVVAQQSVVHAVVHKENLIPTHYKAKTETGVEYDVYRPYTLSFGNNDPFKKLTAVYNKRAITSLLKKINIDLLYCHFWSSALPVYDFALKNKRPLFVACGEGDNALEDMVANMPKDKFDKLVEAVTGVVSFSSENKRKCLDFGLITEDDLNNANFNNALVDWDCY